MLALVSTPGGSEPVEIREASEPDPAPDETLVEVRAFSINRGELSLLSNRPEGWSELGGAIEALRDRRVNGKAVLFPE